VLKIHKLKKQIMETHLISGSTIINEKNGTFSVQTPVSLELGFALETDAKKYASTYGRVDKRYQWVDRNGIM
jgi:hypothetical protein